MAAAVQTRSWSQAANANAAPPVQGYCGVAPAEVQLRAAVQTGRAISRRLNSASSTSGAAPLSNPLKINFNYAGKKNATAFFSLAGLNHFHMQKDSFILPEIHGQAAKARPPPPSISHSGRAAPRRQPSRRTRMERAGGKKRDFHHLPTRSPTPGTEKFPASSHLPPPSFRHSHFILLQKLGKNVQRAGARKRRRGRGGRRTGSFDTEE